jgi:hypothetical protein
MAVFLEPINTTVHYVQGEILLIPQVLRFSLN